MNHRYVLVGLALVACALLLSFLFFLRRRQNAKPHVSHSSDPVKEVQEPSEGLADVCEGLTVEEVVNRVRTISAFFGPSDKAACLCLRDMNACNRVCSLFSETPHTPEDIRTITTSLQWVERLNVLHRLFPNYPFSEELNSDTCTFNPSAELTPMSLYRLGAILQFMRSDDAIPLKYVAETGSLKSKEELYSMFKDALAAIAFRKQCSTKFRYFKPLNIPNNSLVSACRVGFVAEKEMIDRVKSEVDPNGHLLKYFSDSRGVRNQVNIETIKTALKWSDFDPQLNIDYDHAIRVRVNRESSDILINLTLDEIVQIMPADFYTDEWEKCLSTKNPDVCRELIEKFKPHLDSSATGPLAGPIQLFLGARSDPSVDPSQRVMAVLTGLPFRQMVGDEAKCNELIAEAQKPIAGLYNVSRNLKFPRAMSLASKLMTLKSESTEKIREFWDKYFMRKIPDRFYADVFLFASVAPKTNDADLFISIGYTLCAWFPSMQLRDAHFCKSNYKNYNDFMRLRPAFPAKTLSTIITSDVFSLKEAIRQIAIQVYGQRLDDVITQSNAKRYVVPAGMEPEAELGGLDLDNILMGDGVIPDLLPQENKYHNHDCRICLENFTDGNTVTSPPCGHLSHTSCWRRWTKIRSTCPSCNT